MKPAFNGTSTQHLVLSVLQRGKRRTLIKQASHNISATQLGRPDVRDFHTSDSDACSSKETLSCSIHFNHRTQKKEAKASMIPVMNLNQATRVKMKTDSDKGKQHSLPLHVACQYFNRDPCFTRQGDDNARLRRRRSSSQTKHQG